MFVFRRVIIYVIFHKFWICHFLWRVSLCPNLPWPHEGYCKLNHNILYDILLREVSTDVFPNRSTRGNPRKITSKFHHPHKSVEIKKWPNFQLDDSHFQDLVTLVLPAISSKGFSRTHRVPPRAPTSSCMGELHGTKKTGRLHDKRAWNQKWKQKHDELWRCLSYKKLLKPESFQSESSIKNQKNKQHKQRSSLHLTISYI